MADWALAKHMSASAKEWLTTKVAGLVVFAGTVLIGVAVFLQRAPTDTIWRLITAWAQEIGTAAVAGGIFLWLTKTAQVTGAIRQELEATIYSERHLKNRKDIKELWLAATRALHNSSFTEIN